MSCQSPSPSVRSEPRVVKASAPAYPPDRGRRAPRKTASPLVREVRDAASALGKDANLLHIVCRGNYRVYDTSQGKDRRPLWGTLDEIREDIRRYADAGLYHLVALDV
jgi:hypothetical protein